MFRSWIVDRRSWRSGGVYFDSTVEMEVGHRIDFGLCLVFNKNVERYKVLFYGGDRKNGVRDFIFKSSKNLGIKIFSQIDHLKEFGLSKSNPSLKKASWNAFLGGKNTGKG